MTVNQPRTVPRDGLANPTFDGMGQSEDLIVSLSFLPRLTDPQLRAACRWVRELEISTDLGDRGTSPFGTGEPFVHEHLFHARIGNLLDPRAAVVSLIDTLTAMGVRIQDAFFACWERASNGVMRPRRDPRAPTGAPESECESDLRGGILVMDELVLEHRGSPLYFPDFRIEYGTVSSERVKEIEPDGGHRRTEDVRRALVSAIESGWSTVFKAHGKNALRPRPLNAQGDVDQIDRIVADGRVGYLFSIEALTLLDRPSPDTCRLREYELMEAVIAAVEALGLAKTITWQRYGTPLLIPPIKRPDFVEIQVWEETR